jgi:hypothetical protein
MNSQPSKLNWFVIVLGTALALICVGLMVSNSRLRGDLDRAKHDTAMLKGKLEISERQVSSGAPEEARPGTSEETSGAPPSPGPAPLRAAQAASSKPKPRRQVDAEAMGAMMKNPMMQRIMASQTSAIMQMTYSDLMDRLQLSPEERDYLQRLLVDKQTSVQNLGMQFMNPGLSNDDRKALGNQLNEAWKAGEAKIREFLNDEADFGYYQSYTKQEPERREVGMFKATLGGETLDPATSDALANLQSEARKQFPFTVDFYDQRNFGNTSALNTAAVSKFLEEQSQFQTQVAEKAAGLLTPAQLQTYKQNQAAVRQMFTMHLNSIVQLAGGGGQ